MCDLGHPQQFDSVVELEVPLKNIKTISKATKPGSGDKNICHLVMPSLSPCLKEMFSFLAPCCCVQQCMLKHDVHEYQPVSISKEKRIIWENV